MRIPAIILIASAAVSCTTAPPSPEQLANAAAQRQAALAPLIAGKAPGAPISCLAPRIGSHMTIIGPNLVAFRDSSRRVYLNDMRGTCPNLREHHALVTRQFGGGTGLCSGEVAEVRDLGVGGFVGTCVFGEFTPYTATGG